MASRSKYSFCKAMIAAGAFITLGAGTAIAAIPNHVMDTQNSQKNLGGYVQLAQATDPRVFQLEEQIRQLNGRVEEMNFLMLEMQEQLRRMQQDNEFRFQELENGNRSDASPSINSVEPQSDVATIIDQNNNAAAPSLGAPEQPLGSIRFDANGNPIGAEGGSVVTSGLPTDALSGGVMDSDALYQAGYDLILAGDYAAAEPVFLQHKANFPDDPRATDVDFWLGESLLGQNRFADAAEAYLVISRDQPQSTRAPDALFKLGVALVGLGRNDIACSTFDQVPVRYPQAAPALLTRVNAERTSANC